MATPQHPLEKYLNDNDISYAGFAKQIGGKTSPDSIRLICKGYRPPGSKLAFAIEQLTDGEVSAVEMLFWVRAA